MSRTPVALALPAPAGEMSAAQARRAEAALWAVVALAIFMATGAAMAGASPVPVLSLFVFGLVLVAGQRVFLAWQTMFGAILVVILFIPIRRYTIAGGGPVELEPYRVLIAVVLGCWALALAADPRVRWRTSPLGRPITILWFAIGASVALNLGRVNANSEHVLKALTFFGSYFLVVYMIGSVIRRGRPMEVLLGLLVAGGAVLSIFALFEWRSGINAFNGLGRFLPFLQYQDIGAAMVRGHGARALASAQHPIALGAALVMLLPPAIFLYKRTEKVVWLIAGALLVLAALSTGSRTAMTMMVAMVVFYFVTKRGQMVKMIPHMIALLICIQGVMPGTLGSFYRALNPAYVIQEQSTEMGGGSGRLADLGPSLAEWSRSPFVGQGFGTRMTSADGVTGAQILDNQWLSTLLELGALGTGCLLWVLCRAIRLLSHRAREMTERDSWLPSGLAASLTAYTVGMFTFDAFAFVQVTFLAFVMLGFATILIRDE